MAQNATAALGATMALHATVALSGTPPLTNKANRENLPSHRRVKKGPKTSQGILWTMLIVFAGSSRRIDS
jgi:hypothetical protein